MTARRQGSHPEVEWLTRFEARAGHPLRVLHIGNIANNAYNNAKIQRRYGIAADVVCHDYYHVMGTPEWEDADFQGNVGDPFFPDWWGVDLQGFQRPRWFAQGRLSTCQRYLLAYRSGKRLRTALLWRQLRIELWFRCRSTAGARTAGALLGIAHGSDTPYAGPPVAGLRNADATGSVEAVGVRLRDGMWHVRTRSVWRLRQTHDYTVSRARLIALKVGQVVHATARMALGEHWRTAVLSVFPRRAARVARTPAHHTSVARARARAVPGSAEGAISDLDERDARCPAAARFRELFPERSPLTVKDVTGYLPALPRWQALFGHYDVIQAYSTDPIIPLLCGCGNYAAYEHGTLREIPFEESDRGRVCALAYREAPVVFVTNSDVMPSVARLGIDAARVVRLPHAFDSDKLLDFAFANPDARPPETGPPVVFAPARHDWVDGDPNFSKGNDVLLRALAILAEEGVPWRAVLVGWGRDLEASLALADELGIAEWLDWVPPMRKRELWKRYLASHAVADQFTLPAIGGVAFEAMVLGRRLVTALDHEQAASFFGESPPVPDCRTPLQTAAALRTILLDPSDAVGAGEAIRTWFLRYHSTARIVELQVEAYTRLLGQHGSDRHETAAPR